MHSLDVYLFTIWASDNVHSVCLRPKPSAIQLMNSVPTTPLSRNAPITQVSSTSAIGSTPRWLRSCVCRPLEVHSSQPSAAPCDTCARLADNNICQCLFVRLKCARADLPHIDAQYWWKTLHVVWLAVVAAGQDIVMVLSCCYSGCSEVNVCSQSISHP